jgi:hypothetical protein
MRLSQCHPLTGWLAGTSALAARMRDDICDNSVQEARLWLCYDYRVEPTRAFPQSALASTRDPHSASPPETLRSLRH